MALIRADPVEMASSLSQAFIKSLNSIIEAFGLLISSSSRSFCQNFMEHVGVLGTWLAINSEFGKSFIDRFNFFSFAYF